LVGVVVFQVESQGSNHSLGYLRDLRTDSSECTIGIVVRPDKHSEDR
jgi:hypothetical protein